ncbi:MAG: FkbM family methyltransferase [Planctomycetota bacterium]|jgi:FkbM family methyltransferase
MKRMLKSLVKSGKPRPNLQDAFLVQKLLLGDTGRLTIFDVGAYVGKVAMIYRDMFPEAVIRCFEPFPDSFEQLNRIADGEFIRPYQIALCEAEGKANLQIDSDNSCNSLLPRPTVEVKYYPQNSQNIGHIEVKTQSLDAFCDKEGIAEIDILKLDVEGAELKVLRGASERLKSERIGLIYAEVMFVPHYGGGCLFHEVSGFLSQHGYTLLNLYDLRRAQNGQLRWGNAIFLSPGMRAQFESAGA